MTLLGCFLIQQVLSITREATAASKYVRYNDLRVMFTVLGRGGFRIKENRYQTKSNFQDHELGS